MYFSEIILCVYVIALLLLLFWGLHGLIMLFYRGKYNSDINLPILQDKFPFITIQLPIYNEINVVERLINAVCKLNYPIDKFEIQILDDSTDTTSSIVKRLVASKTIAGFNISQIIRKDRDGFKAGALKEGLLKADGEFIAIFDADFIPSENFLLDTLPYFNDSKIGMVQTRWDHINEDYSVLTKLQALSLNSHFVIDQTVKNKSGFFINFNGTGGIWRKSCIEDAGNWHSDTLTEDLDLSYRAQLKGWKFKFLNNITSPGELPAEMNSLKAQQFRWTKGTIETARKIIPLLWRSDIPAKIKLQSTYQLLSNLSFPILLVVSLLNLPLVFVKNNIADHSIFNFMSVFVLGLISSFLYFLYSQKDISKDWVKKTLYFPLFMAGSIGLAVNNSLAVFEGLFNKRSDFIRTPKFMIQNKSSSIKKKKYLNEIKLSKVTLVEMFFAVYCSLGVAASIYFNEIASLPFHIIFTFGFGSVSLLSLKHSLIK
ncbi:MAG: glycosyltransferase [Melioribacteraceae bacterium]|nr:glycosyltransferase [Melioribacteraceae bacterium]